MQKQALGGKPPPIERLPITVQCMLKRRLSASLWKSGYHSITHTLANVVFLIERLLKRQSPSLDTVTQTMSLEPILAQKSSLDRTNFVTYQKWLFAMMIRKQRSLKRLNLPRSLVQYNRRSPSSHTCAKSGKRTLKKNDSWAYRSRAYMTIRY